MARKQDEIESTDSCIGHAHPKEMVFVLLGRYTAAPFAIRAWAGERVRLGKNSWNDPQIVEALACADTMAEEGRKWVGAATHYPEGSSCGCPDLGEAVMSKLNRTSEKVVEFQEFDKIARLNREVVVTEKIDGTNGLVWVSDDSAIVRAGSRSRWITPEDDNFGFARWVAEHVEELRALGPGYHYGEWWGSGIQRRYGLTEKRWSLFNVARWGDDAVRPKCCHVVPVLASGVGLSAVAGSAVGDALALLRTCGSQAAPGFDNPEGVVIYHTAARSLFKVTLEKDEMPKGQAEREARS